LLDYSRAVTGTLFFVPSATFLEGVTADKLALSNAPDTKECQDEDEPKSRLSSSDGSLGIGSLKEGNRM
jgi:porphyrinogen peroxidase